MRWGAGRTVRTDEFSKGLGETHLQAQAATSKTAAHGARLEVGKTNMSPTLCPELCLV